jgi:hypothetical protein
MIVRRCSQGHRIRIHRNATPGVTRTKKYHDGSTETLTYPSSYNYFVDVHPLTYHWSDGAKTMIALKFYDEVMKDVKNN